MVDGLYGLRGGQKLAWREIVDVGEVMRRVQMREMDTGSRGFDAT
jgi:hypothetical protein